MAATSPRTPNGKTNELTTALVTPVTLFTIPMVANQVVRVHVQVECRQLSSFGRALFERVGLFYNDGVSSFIQGPTWTATATEKSDINFGISYILNATSIDIKVTNANAVNTTWFGRLDTDVV
jgi:hypothetical protein